MSRYVYLRKLVKAFVPPVIVTKIKSSLGYSNKFIGPFASWQEAEMKSQGYESKVILDKVLSATKKVKSGDAAFERDSVLFDEIQYSWPVLSALLWAASRKKRHLHVVDFGGALGSSYYQNQKFLQNIPSLKWSIVEQAHYVEAGRKHIEHGQLRFYETFNDAVKDEPADVVLFSGVLQYLEEPFQILEALVKNGPKIIVIDKLIINGTNKNQVFVQKVPSHIYRASYPVWSLSQIRLLEFFGTHGYRLVESFDAGDFPQIHSFGASFRGYILQLKENT